MFVIVIVVVTLVIPPQIPTIEIFMRITNDYTRKCDKIVQSRISRDNDNNGTDKNYNMISNDNDTIMTMINTDTDNDAS